MPKFFVISPESGITPSNIKDCMSAGTICCNDVNSIKEIDFNPETDFWVIDPSSGLTAQDLMNIQNNMIWIPFGGSKEGIKKITIMEKPNAVKR